MSRSDSGPPRPLTCSDVRFVQVEFPAMLRPRMVIEFSEGLSLLLEDQDAIPLAAGFIAVFRLPALRLSRSPPNLRSSTHG